MLVHSDVFSQERFNVRYNVEAHPATILNSVIELPDGYACTGVAADTTEKVNGRTMVFSLSLIHI